MNRVHWLHYALTALAVLAAIATAIIVRRYAQTNTGPTVDVVAPARYLAGRA